MPPEPFVACESEFPPIMGIAHFYATLTAVPLMLVPISASREAIAALSHSHHTEERAYLLYWTSCLTLLFFTNLLQHTLGPSCNVYHEAMAAVQSVANAGLLNALRRREGSLSSLPLSAMRVFVVVATAGAILVTVRAPHRQAVVCAPLTALTAPFIMWTTGVLSRGDALAWPRFLRSCVGLVVVLAATGVEPHVCGVPIVAPLYHALLDHGAIVLLFGSVSRNAVHLTVRPRWAE